MTEHSTPARHAGLRIALLIAASLASTGCVTETGLLSAWPKGVLETTAAPIAGPELVGNAFPVMPGQWLTCRHVVPAEATSFDLHGERFRAPPIASGSTRARGDDWTVVRAPTPNVFLPVDFARPLHRDTPVWILGWTRRSDGPGTSYDRVGVSVYVVGRAEGSDYWTVRGMGSRIHAGLSGAPVVAIDATTGAPRVVGLYTATVKTTRSLLGIPLGTDTVNVFIRPPVHD